MDTDAVFNQFLAREENTELRKLLAGNPNDQWSSQKTDGDSGSWGNVHSERLSNITGAADAVTATRPKHFELDEIEDVINLDGNELVGDTDLQWNQLALSQELLKGIQAKGFVKPSRIQQVALPLILGASRNIIAQAKNGSGKTATFALAMLSKVQVGLPRIQALCLCPTRELATQNVAVIQQLGQFSNIKTFLGVPQCPRFEEKDGHHLYVGTPGKTMDFIKRRICRFQDLKLFVLDEADELINQANNMGPQVLQIRREFRQPLQILLFSATFSDEVRVFAQNIAPNAHVIKVSREKLTLATIDQRYMVCIDDEDKFSKLCELYASLTIGQSVIFVNSRDVAFKLSTRMKSQGHAVSLLCGTLGPNSGPNSMTPEIRDRIMKEFKDGDTKVLICTDVLARGIDVPQVTLVINYELPLLYSGSVKDSSSLAVNMETYLHRIGRTGRFGVRGMAINFVTPNEMALIDTIRNFYKCEINILDMDPEAIEQMFVPVPKLFGDEFKAETQLGIVETLLTSWCGVYNHSECLL